jgi:hypothetical protein
MERSDFFLLLDFSARTRFVTLDTADSEPDSSVYLISFFFLDELRVRVGLSGPPRSVIGVSALARSAMSSITSSSLVVILTLLLDLRPFVSLV